MATLLWTIPCMCPGCVIAPLRSLVGAEAITLLGSLSCSSRHHAWRGTPTMCGKDADHNETKQALNMCEGLASRALLSGAATDGVP